MKKISKNCLDLVKKFEGCRLTAYRDEVGVWTIGYGITNSDKSITGTTIKRGLKISKETAEKWLEESLNKKYLPLVLKYDEYNWNQNELDALVSFAYNIGSITQLTAKGTRSKKTIAAKLLEYNKAGGKVYRGLTRRRKAEQKLFITPIKKKSNKTIAKEVLAGKWGNNPERKKKLIAAGYDYEAIRKIVNKLAK
ncbi:glycoside hydrolase family protein [Anaerobutyricum hallii]|jgi:GH24 family phage-related lysozyme (muramidase)|uniref:glycoside hydrolase family protein n=1 Tax=Anaerobutyricum hallii TaxID=39488 RepID=UPI001FD754AF|nr:glycoside hydrolase family protein [Anaerobutyricum hallii]